MFGSESLVVHLGRGIVGFGAAALGIASGHVVMLPLMVITLVALRGCPMCWTIGLVQIVINHYHRGSNDVVLCASCSTVERE
jgi:hypothetical protein